MPEKRIEISIELCVAFFLSVDRVADGHHLKGISRHRRKGVTTKYGLAVHRDVELSGQHRDDTSGFAHAKAGRRCGNNVLECLAVVDLGRMNERVGADEPRALRRFYIVLAGSGAEESAQDKQERK